MPKRRACFVHSSFVTAAIDLVVLSPIIDWRGITVDQERLYLKS